MEDSIKAILMNDYFSNVGAELISKIQPTKDHFDMQHIYRNTPTLT